MYGQTVQLNEHATLDVYPVWSQAQADRLPAVLILPGGGYLYTSPRESGPVALKVNTHYLHAMVLHYTTVAHRSVTLEELIDEVRQAIEWIQGQADRLHIDTRRISLMGFSAGGHLAAHCSSKLASMVDKAILAYPATHFPRMTHDQMAEIFHRMFGRISDPRADEVRIRDAMIGILSNDPTPVIGEQTRPTFIFQTAEDTTVDPHATVQYAMALMEHSVPCEMVLFQKGPHGLSLADETCNQVPFPHQARWFDQAMSWLKDQDRSQPMA